VNVEKKSSIPGHKEYINFYYYVTIFLFLVMFSNQQWWKRMQAHVPLYSYLY